LATVFLNYSTYTFPFTNWATDYSTFPNPSTLQSGTIFGGYTAVPPTCTSFTYSDWSACGSNNLKTRTILNSFPAGCSGGNYESLTQDCVYVSHDAFNSFEITNPPSGFPNYRVQLPPYKNTFPLISRIHVVSSAVAQHIRYAIKEWQDNTFDAGIEITVDNLPPEMRLLSEAMDSNGFITTELDLSDIKLNPDYNVHYYTASFYDIDDETHTPWGKIQFTVQGVSPSDITNYSEATPNSSAPSDVLLNGSTGGSQDLGFLG
jgi:hypothetical protein